MRSGGRDWSADMPAECRQPPVLGHRLVEMSVSEIAAAVGGEMLGREVTVDGVAIDSRLVRGGELFVPIVAERDGHDFIADAVRAGAAAYLTAGPIASDHGGRGVTDTASGAAGRRPPGPLHGCPTGWSASRAASARRRRRTCWPRCWPRRYRTTASERSFNNELGVPLTLANAPDADRRPRSSRWAPAAPATSRCCATSPGRRSASSPSWPAPTSRCSAPIDDVAQAKGELVESLPADGYGRAQRRRRAGGGHGRPHQRQGAGVRRERRRRAGRGRSTLDDDAAAVVPAAEPRGATATCGSAVRGAHQVMNALAAAAAALALGVDLDDVVAGLAGAELSAMRMELSTEPQRRALVLNDAYNANPTSMRGRPRRARGARRPGGASPCSA